MSQHSGSTLCPDGCPDPRDAEIARLTAALATERASHAAALAALRERCAVVADNAAAHADKHYHKHGFALSGGSVASRIADKIRALPIGAEGGEG